MVFRPRSCRDRIRQPTIAGPLAHSFRDVMILWVLIGEASIGMAQCHEIQVNLETGNIIGAPVLRGVTYTVLVRSGNGFAPEQYDPAAIRARFEAALAAAQ